MKEIALSNQAISDLLKEHKCPKCGSWDILFYNPNLTDNHQIQIEVECENCTLYVIILAKLKQFYDNRM